MKPITLTSFALALALIQPSFAQEVFTPANAQEQILYQRAYEVAIWATPMLNSLQLRNELLKHGAQEGDLGYLGAHPTGKLEVPTFNNVTPTVFGGGSLKRGPMVIDVPAASDKAKYFGTLMNVWDSAIEDFGPDGADSGKGGKFLLLPPAWNTEVPGGYTPLRSSSYEFHVWLRSVPVRTGEEGWADAVEYAKTLKVYPLAEAASPKPTGWFDVTRVTGYFRGNPYFGLDSFRLIDDYVQNEPVQEFDKAMHGMLAEIGIQKGKPFAPDEATAKILDQAARAAERYMRGALESGKVFDRYWPDRAWGGFRLHADIIRSAATWNLADRLDYHARAVNFF
jgi:hypothetical protein